MEKSGEEVMFVDIHGLGHRIRVKAYNVKSISITLTTFQVKVRYQTLSLKAA